jgi:hypothetical protein
VLIAEAISGGNPHSHTAVLPCTLPNRASSWLTPLASRSMYSYLLLLSPFPYTTHVSSWPALHGATCWQMLPWSAWLLHHMLHHSLTLLGWAAGSSSEQVSALLTTGTTHYADGPELCRRLFVIIMYGFSVQVKASKRLGSDNRESNNCHNHAYDKTKLI